MVKRTLWPSIVIVLCAGLTTGRAAQFPGPPPLTGNPTPGTPQPDPPNLADRITLTGCVQSANENSGRGAAAVDPNEPSDSTYVLTNAQRENRVPPGTGTSGAAAASASRTYRLAAINSSITAFVGTKVEVSGEVEPSTTNAAGAVNASAPILHVGFIQKLAPSCQ